MGPAQQSLEQALEYIKFLPTLVLELELLLQRYLSETLPSDTSKNRLLCFLFFISTSGSPTEGLGIKCLPGKYEDWRRSP